MKKIFRGFLHSKHNVIAIFICISLCFISIGYATLSTRLNIIGSVKTSPGVYFKNIRVFGGGVTPLTAVNISDDTSMGFKVTLSQADDFYKFLFDVENKRTVDMMVKNITTSTISDKVDLIITYKDGTPVKSNDILPTNSSATLLIVFKYKDGVTPSTITQDVTFTINYQAANSSGRQVETDYTVEDFMVITNGVLTQNYTDGIQSEMYAFDHPATEQLRANTDYRYISKTPDNYIKYNDEMWRIIGVFPTDDGSGTIKNRLKIVRDELVADMKFDHKKNGIGTSLNDYGSNDWSDAQLMYFLNPNDIATNAGKKGYIVSGNYVKDTHGTVIYEKGKVPAEVSSGATTYGGAENTWRISDAALLKADSVKFYLGSNGYDSANETFYTTEEKYAYERGNTGRTANYWLGKVGIIYPSDFTYVYAKGVNESCYNNAFHCDSVTSISTVKNWLDIFSKPQWTITQNADNNYYTFAINGLGVVHAYYIDYEVSTEHGVRPTVYLNSDIRLSGFGTKQNPYVIK